MTTNSLADIGIVALLAFVPLVVLMLTSFVKVSVVLSLLRNAIGATDAPSGLVVMGVSLILTFFVMAPVAVEMVTASALKTAPPSRTGATPAGTAPPGAAAPNQVANVPPSAPAAPNAAPAAANAAPTTPNAAANSAANAGADAAEASASGASGPAATRATTAQGSADGTTSADRRAPAPDLFVALRAIVPAERREQVDAVARAVEPLKRFLARHASERDKQTFVDLGATLGQVRTADELAVLAPAFLTTELREAFAIAVLIFIPFLVIDLLVGLGLAALGLQSTSPQVVALPVKLLLFVAVDGWRLLIDALLRGYA